MQLNSTAVKYLTRQEREKVQRAFRLFDSDGSGSISVREFDMILKSLGQVMREQQLQLIIQTIDKDGNGQIDFNEFLELVAPKIIANRSEKQFAEAFKILDECDDGVIDKHELQRANLISCANLTQAQIDEILAYVDNKYEGEFSLETALRILFRIQAPSE